MQLAAVQRAISVISYTCVWQSQTSCSAGVCISTQVMCVCSQRPESTHPVSCLGIQMFDPVDKQLAVHFFKLSSQIYACEVVTQ